MIRHSRHWMVAVALTVTLMARAGAWYEDELTAGAHRVGFVSATAKPDPKTGRYTAGRPLPGSTAKGTPHCDFIQFHLPVKEAAGKYVIVCLRGRGRGWVNISTGMSSAILSGKHQLLENQDLGFRAVLPLLATNATVARVHINSDWGATFEEPVFLVSDAPPAAAVTNPHLAKGGTLPPGYVEGRSPALPAGELNLAPFADSHALGAFPSRLARATDGSLGTYEPHPFVLEFPKLVTLTGFRWTLPTRTMELLADTDGDGIFETTLYRESNGPVFTTCAPDYVWLDRRFEKPITARRILAIGRAYELQLLGPASEAAHLVRAPYRPAGAALGVGAPLEKPPASPSADEAYRYGFTFEPWMFGVQNHLAALERDGTPLGEIADWPEWAKIVADYKTLHANFILLFPPQTFVGAKGVNPPCGTPYPYPLLWPSAVWYANPTNDLLTSFHAACHAAGIESFVTPRDWSFKTNHTAELKQVTLAREIAARGADGVPICCDEHIFNCPPATHADTRAARQSYLDKVGETAAWMAAIKADQLKVNPKALTFGGFGGCDYTRRRPSRMSGSDFWGYDGRCDVIGGDGTYFGVGENYGDEGIDLGTLTPAVETAVQVAYTPKRLSMATMNFNFALAWNKNLREYAHPPCYDEFPRIAYTAGALATFFNKGTHLNWWRYNFMDLEGPKTRAAVTAGGYMTEVLAAWGGKRAEVPKDVLVLRSRPSEDWWFFRGYGKRLDQDVPHTQSSDWGHRLFLWTAARLAERATPFEVYPLHRVATWKDLAAAYRVIVLPFAYAVSDAEAAALQAAARAGVKILLVGGDEAGLVDGIGEKRERNAFADIPVVRFTIKNASVPATKSLARAFDAALGRLLPHPSLALDREADHDVQAYMLSVGKREKLVMVANWSERETSANLHLALPHGSYRMEVCTDRDVRAGTIDGQAIFGPEAAASFRIDLEREGVRLLRIRPTSAFNPKNTVIQNR